MDTKRRPMGNCACNKDRPKKAVSGRGSKSSRHEKSPAEMGAVRLAGVTGGNENFTSESKKFPATFMGVIFDT